MHRPADEESGVAVVPKLLKFGDSWPPVSPLKPQPHGSPYLGKDERDWPTITSRLAAGYPLLPQELTNTVLQAWESILHTKIAGNLQIGRDYNPSPQVMGDFLHKLIPITLSKKYPGAWRQDETRMDKDLVYIPDNAYSLEIKTSSSASGIFGNRSYAQPSSPGTKDKSGFYLAINFQKFITGQTPKITLIRFGWLDHTDWYGQAAETGQMAAPSAAARRGKFIQLLSLKK